MSDTERKAERTTEETKGGFQEQLRAGLERFGERLQEESKGAEARIKDGIR